MAHDMQKQLTFALAVRALAALMHTAQQSSAPRSRSVLALSDGSSITAKTICGFLHFWWRRSGSANADSALYPIAMSGFVKR